ncbi:OmpA family protein [Marivita sp. S0852]|uniref:OmpA family protein n=1 Tax=Marivita sp. S0852 TaxID=3373893 RepID=UPI0039823EC0
MALQKNLRIPAALTGLALLAACAGSDPVYSAFSREAGALVDPGNFGNATMNNMQIMNGEMRYTYDLSQRFASEVMTTVNFAFNSAVLDSGARDTLREQAHWIRQFPEVRFRVYGHTDAVGSEAYNKRLGLNRAHAVVNYLASQGIDKSRLEAVVSFGETQPLIVTEGRERRNRRTVTEVSGFVGSHPTVMDGKYAEIIYREYINSAVPRSRLSGIQGSDFATEE